MFSSRLNWNAPANPLSRLLDAKRRRGETVLDLTESNPTRAEFVYPQERILAALSDPRSLRYVPDPAGLRAAREAVAEYYGGGVAPEQILLTASTSEAYGYAFKLLANPGDQVLAPRPSYPLLDFLARLESVELVEYPLIYAGEWSIDFEELKRRVSSRTRAIVVVNPNNPTGSFLKRAEFEQLVGLCRTHQLAIISDEVFSDYAFGEDTRCVRSLVGVEDVLTFVLSGLSKLVGLPQVKLGWMVVAGPPAVREEAMNRLELIADTYLSVGTPVQWAAAPLLGLRGEVQRQIRDRICTNRELLESQIGTDSPWRILRAEGGWYATLEAPRIHTEEEWTLTLLGEDNVLIQPGFFFDFEREAYLVASLLTPPETFREGVRRILARAR